MRKTETHADSLVTYSKSAITAALDQKRDMFCEKRDVLKYPYIILQFSKFKIYFGYTQIQTKRPMRNFVIEFAQFGNN